MTSLAIGPFDSITAAKSGLVAYLMASGATLDDTLQQRLTDAMACPSPVDMLVQSMEALYAAHTDLDDAGKALVAQLSGFIVANGWHGINQDDRGNRIIRAMLRELGEIPPLGVTWPEVDDDPAVDARFVTSPGVSAGFLGNAGIVTPADPDNA